MRWTGTAATVIAAGLVASVPVAGATQRGVIGAGPDQVYGTNPMSTATATVSAGASADGTEQLVLDVDGVDATPGMEFGAHVHVNPCGPNPGDAGGHYVNPDADGAMLHREVWLDVHVDAHGRGHATATRNWRVTHREARSVVIHALRTDRHTGAAGARLACIDLDA